MNVAVKSLLAFATILTLETTVRAEYDVNAFCTIVKNGVKLASMENCQMYYTCMNGKATENNCPADQAFDKNQQGCRPASDVGCINGGGNGNPCEGKSGVHVPLPNTCNGWIYCKDGKDAGRGQCPVGQIFYGGECIHGKCNDNNGNGEKELTSVCQIMPDRTLFGSTKNCKIYQSCDKGVLSQGTCEGDDGKLVFDVQRTLCNYESGNMCSRVTGKDIQPDPTPSLPCTESDKGKKKADIAKCSSYQVCDGKYWVNTPCGAGQYYSPGEQKCQSRQTATPYKDCNRCEYTKYQFVNAVDPDCRKYLVCKNGVVDGSNSCSAQSYFDESAQACILDRDGLKKYAERNGACKSDDGNNGGDDDKCKKTCEALEKDKCEEKDNCACGLEDDKCTFCKNGVDDEKNCKPDDNSGNDDKCKKTCEALEKDTCEKQDDCECGLEEDKCTVCKNGVDEEKKCKPDDNDGGEGDKCKTTCEALDKDTCEIKDDCNCGLEDDKCTECKNGVGADKKCEAEGGGGGGTDCDAATCTALEGADCKKTGDCDCGMDDADKCVLCENGIDDEGKCNV